ncbi:MAG: type I methionyl aminopeptidase [Desulfovermiculus sp.]|nr:type I methionyl aminopeptidase [Desulfovermiculus sp.]
MRFGRNDPCPCGSGLKYKKCCLEKEGRKPAHDKDVYYKKYKIRLKEAEDIESIRRVGALVVKTLDLVESHIRPGISTEYINSLVHDFTLQHGATPAPLNYNGFPKSVCVSVNEVICHGIPGERMLQEGDIINVDVTSIIGGYFADANKTFCVGQVSEDAHKIVHVARRALSQGLNQVRPGNRIGDIGWAIQDWAESQRCSVVREMVGHGVGFQFHEPPQIPHFGNKGQGIVLVPGMVFTVEPMINLGRRELRILDDNWTAVTKDGSLSAQFEQTIVVTEEGYESLTPY